MKKYIFILFLSLSVMCKSAFAFDEINNTAAEIEEKIAYILEKYRSSFPRKVEYESYITGFRQGSRFNHDGHSYIVVGPGEHFDTVYQYLMFYSYGCYMADPDDWAYGAIIEKVKSVLVSSIDNLGRNIGYADKGSKIFNIQIKYYFMDAIAYIYNSKVRVLPYSSTSTHDTKPNYEICDEPRYSEFKESFIILAIPLGDYPECTEGECYSPDDPPDPPDPPDPDDPPDDPDELVCNDLVATINDYSYFDLFDCYVEKMKTTALFVSAPATTSRVQHHYKVSTTATLRVKPN